MVPRQRTSSGRLRRHKMQGACRGRRGVVLALTAVLMVVIVGFVAFSIDTGMIAVTRTSMQNAVDAAALAAAQEITLAVEQAGDQGDEPDVDANSIAVNAAREMAADVADRNGVFVDSAADVQFGKRTYDEASQKWHITWGEEPFNVIKVQARRDQEDTSAPDGKLKTFFAWILGVKSTSLHAEAIAFVEARDIVTVLDFSASMNDDSVVEAYDRLGASTVKTNMENIWGALEMPNTGTLEFEPRYVRIKGQPPANGSMPQIYVTFKEDSVYVESSKDLSNVVLQFDNGYAQKFQGLSGYNGEFSGTGYFHKLDIRRVWVKSGENLSGDCPGCGERFEDDTHSIVQSFELGEWPYPSGSWSSYISHVKNNRTLRSEGYNKKYGGLTLVDYLENAQESYAKTPSLWRTPHYPFNAMKGGMTLFCDFLQDLGFGDELGLVSYATYAQWETQFSEPYDGTSEDVSDDPISADIQAINNIQIHKQAGHYTSTTAIGDGLKKARQMLAEHQRFGASPVIFLMTDGLANERPYNWSLPGSWNWDELTDFDEDGESDYSTSDLSKLYAFYEAKQAIDAGIVIHTLSVGTNADHALMEAIAKASGGTHIKVDLGGDYSLEALEAKVLDAYSKIAGKVPPPRLVSSEEAAQ